MKISATKPTPKRPAPEQRVAADGDEDRGELESDEAELREEEDGRDHRPEQLLQEVPKRGEAAARLDRLVVAELRVLLHRLTVAVPRRNGSHVTKPPLAAYNERDGLSSTRCVRRGGGAARTPRHRHDRAGEAGPSRRLPLLRRAPRVREDAGHAPRRAVRPRRRDRRQGRPAPGRGRRSRRATRRRSRASTTPARTSRRQGVDEPDIVKTNGDDALHGREQAARGRRRQRRAAAPARHAEARRRLEPASCCSPATTCSCSRAAATGSSRCRRWPRDDRALRRRSRSLTEVDVSDPRRCRS